MPLYEYECNACRHRFELIQKFSDPPPEACTSCGTGPVRRLLSSPAIQFKGSGWYITDYARKGGGGEGATLPASGQGSNGNGNGGGPKPAEGSTPAKAESSAKSGGETSK